MRKHINYIFLILVLLLFVSCTTKEMSVGYRCACFNKDNKIIYIKDHSYFHWDYTKLLGAEVYDSYHYLCKMDLYGNEEIFEIVPGKISVVKLSSSENGRLCIQTGSYSAYTYIDGKFTEVLKNKIYDARISFDGKKLTYVKKENDTYTLCVSNVDGTGEKTFGFGFNPSWLPDNNSLVYIVSDYPDWYYYILDTTTSNIKSISYRYYWSHDLQRIAYYDETDHLVLMNEDETGKVVTDWDDSDKRVVWSYDGEYLLSDFHLLDKNGNLIRTLREKE